LVPGNCDGLDVGVADSLTGNVTGSLPEGSTDPKSTAATAFPSSSPGYQASRTAGTWLSHGMRTGLPLFTTTIVRGFAAATADTSASWSPERDRLDWSAPSDSVSPTMTTATSAAFAAATAEVMSDPSL
jgi:hypothetical protein